MEIPDAEEQEAGKKHKQDVPLIKQGVQCSIYCTRYT